MSKRENLDYGVGVAVFDHAAKILSNEMDEGVCIINEKKSKGEEPAEKDNLKAAQFITCMVMTSFTIELLLKSMLQQKENEPKKIHALDRLFDKLDDGSKDIIRNNILNELKINMHEFNDYLSSNNDSFVIWRYFFEEGEKKGDLHFLKTLLNELKNLNELNNSETT